MTYSTTGKYVAEYGEWLRTIIGELGWKPGSGRDAGDPVARRFRIVPIGHS